MLLTIYIYNRIDSELCSQSENDIYARTLKANIIIITYLILDLLIAVGSYLELNAFPSKYFT